MKIKIVVLIAIALMVTTAFLTVHFTGSESLRIDAQGNMSTHVKLSNHQYVVNVGQRVFRRPQLEDGLQLTLDIENDLGKSIVLKAANKSCACIDTWPASLTLAKGAAGSFDIRISISDKPYQLRDHIIFHAIDGDNRKRDFVVSIRGTAFPEVWTSKNIHRHAAHSPTPVGKVWVAHEQGSDSSDQPVIREGQFPVDDFTVALHKQYADAFVAVDEYNLDLETSDKAMPLAGRFEVTNGHHVAHGNFLLRHDATLQVMPAAFVIGETEAEGCTIQLTSKSPFAIRDVQNSAGFAPVQIRITPTANGRAAELRVWVEKPPNDDTVCPLRLSISTSLNADNPLLLSGYCWQAQN